jgi:uncharacterized protein YjdB/photosystem II stability/assembly factor-like uncharacterized protein
LGIELTLLDAAGSTLVTEVAEPTEPVTPGATLDLGTVTLAEVGVVEIAAVTDSRLRVGRALQLRAIAKNGQGVAVERAFRWASSDGSVASVDQSTGLVTGVMAGGPVSITASSGGKRGQIALTVVPRVASVEVTPASVSAKVNGAVSLSATPKDEGNTPLADRIVQWAADNTGVFAVSPAGVVTGVRPGSGELTATVEEVQRKVSVTVTADGVTIAPNPANIAVGATSQLTAVLTDANGAAITTPNLAIEWSSGNTGVATVDRASGVVTGRVLGQATITAAGGGASGQATVNVVSNVIPVAPENPTIQVARSVQLVAQGALGEVAWRSRDANIADVSASGVVSGKRPGTVTITVASATQSGNTTVTVTAARADVTPSAATVAVGDSIQLTAVVRDADGRPIADVPVSWESANANVATVNPSTGTVVGIAMGQASIRVRGGGASGESLVTVGAAPVATIELTPAQPAPILVGNTLQLTATVKDSRGNRLSGRAVTFVSSAPPTASVAPSTATSGVEGTASVTVTGVAAGDATVSASSGDKQVSVLVPVTAPMRTLRITSGGGNGTGIVWVNDGTPLGVLIKCSITGPATTADNCTLKFPEGRRVRLLTEETDGSAFAEWGGVCRGADPCDVTLDADKSVTARFVLPWSRVDSRTTATLYGVWGAPPNFFAVGEGGTILRSTDDGATWTPLATPSVATGLSLRSIWGISSGDGRTSGVTLIVVASNGAILRSANGGATWTAQTPTSSALYEVWGTRDGETYKVFAVGANGTVLRSTDTGVTWTRLTVSPATNATLFGVAASAYTRRLVAVGTSGIVVEGDWLSTTLTSQSTRTPNNLTGVDERGGGGTTPSDDFLVSGDQGTILHRNGDLSKSGAWTIQSTPTQANLHSVGGPLALTQFVVGASGTILRSRNGSWIPSASGTTQHLQQISNWVVVGNGGTILRYTGPDLPSGGPDDNCCSRRR